MSPPPQRFIEPLKSEVHGRSPSRPLGAAVGAPPGGRGGSEGGRREVGGRGGRWGAGGSGGGQPDFLGADDVAELALDFQEMSLELQAVAL